MKDSASPPSSFPPELLQRVTASEGIVLVPYQDEFGNWTVGIGHKFPNPISMRAAIMIRDDDLTIAEADVRSKLPWTEKLDPVRFWSFVELAFNMGLGVPGKKGLESFVDMLAASERGDWNEAAAQLLASAWRHEVGDERADRLAAQIRTGVWT